MQPNDTSMPATPRPRPRLRPLGGWQRASAILIVAATVAVVLTDFGSWAAAGTFWDVEKVVSFGIQVVTAVVFIRWLWLARVNAEAAEPGRHRTTRMWVVLGWFVPIVGFWYPQMVVRDIWNASNPQRPRGTRVLAPTPGANLVTWWWTVFLVNQTAGAVGRALPGTLPYKIGETVAAVAYLVAAPLIITISARITAWQSAADAH